jgi:hypothetical protein
MQWANRRAEVALADRIAVRRSVPTPGPCHRSGARASFTAVVLGRRGAAIRQGGCLCKLAAILVRPLALIAANLTGLWAINLSRPHATKEPAESGTGLVVHEAAPVRDARPSGLRRSPNHPAGSAP